MPRGAAFSDTGMAVLGSDDSDNTVLLGYLNSRLAHVLAAGLHPGRKFEVGHISALPDVTGQMSVSDLTTLVNRLEALANEIDLYSNPARALSGARLDWDLVSGAIDASELLLRHLRLLWREAATTQVAMNRLIEDAVGLSPIEREFMGAHLDIRGGSSSLPAMVGLRPEAIEEILGDEALPPKEVFGRLALYDLLTSIAGRKQAADVIGVADEGHPEDLAVALVRHASDTNLEGPLLILGESDFLRGYFRSLFFRDHIADASVRPRKAPIYWQLATPSASYSVWCYYHRLTRDTFFRVANDYVTPKVDHEERKLNVLRQEAGPDPSSKQRKAIDTQETFIAELRTFKTEVIRIAPLWNPNLNDGVIINFAPLWRLVPQHKPWQKECKQVWDKLVKGDYDWAHLAMHLWAERVVPKCQDDRSLAIAHGLEDEFWYEVEDGKWQKRQVNGDRIEQLVAERASTAVKAALQDLLEAPVPAGQTRRKKKARS